MSTWSRPALETGNYIENPQSSVTCGKSYFHKERLLEIKEQQSCLQPNSRLLQLGNNVSKATRGTSKLLHEVQRHKSSLKDLGRVPRGKALDLGRVPSENIITFVKYLFLLSSCCINL